jgi:hypothetical protein
LRGSRTRSAINCTATKNYSTASNGDTKCGSASAGHGSGQFQHDATTDNHRSADTNHNQSCRTRCVDHPADTGAGDSSTKRDSAGYNTQYESTNQYAERSQRPDLCARERDGDPRGVNHEYGTIDFERKQHDSGKPQQCGSGSTQCRWLAECRRLSGRNCAQRECAGSANVAWTKNEPECGLRPALIFVRRVTGFHVQPVSSQA